MSRKEKTEGIYCLHDSKAVVFQVKAGPAGDRKAWTVQKEFKVDLALVPDSLLCNDGSVTSAKAYGVRALLMDRASDFRAHGATAYIDEMERVFNTVLAVGRFDAERKASGPRVDTYLIQAVANAKGLDYAVAQAAVGKLNEEQRAAIAGKLATEIQALKAAAAQAESVDLDDLLGD